MKILIIAPHPDDETLGAGGTLAMHAKKQDELYWCIVTEAYTPEWTQEFIKRRKEEIIQVAKVYGIKKTFTLGLPTVKLDLVGQKKVNDAMSQVVQEVKPDIVYVPFMYDLNKDHEMTFTAAMVATRPKKDLEIQKILCYETVSETEWGSYSKERAFVPNYYVDISETFDTKVKAMKLYKSELKEAPHPRSEEVMKALAVKRGSECGVKLAESFMVLRIRESL